MSARELRYPMLVGLRSMRLLAIAPAWVVLSLSLAQAVYLVSADVPLPGATAARMAAFAVLVLALGVGVLPWVFVAALVFGGKRARRAVSTRACDVAIGRDGVAVEGGTAGGFRASFESLSQPNGVQFRPDGLWLRGGPKSWLHVPRTGDAEEDASIDALGATLAARAEAASMAKRGAPRERQRRPEGTLHCPGCGSPQAPTDEATFACRHCGQAMTTPPELAEKIRAMRVVARERARDGELARAIVAQPGARFANAVAFGCGLLVWAAASVTVLVSAVLVLLDGRSSGLPRVGGLALIEAGLCLLVVASGNWLLASRRALRALTVGFAAVAPRGEGEPPECRGCGAPLPDPPPGQALAFCLYCSSPNVLAADMRAEGAVVERLAGKAPAPDQVLAGCRRSRRRAAALVAAGAVSAAAGAASLARVSPPPDRSRAAVIPAGTATGFDPLRPGEGALGADLVARLGRRDAWLVEGASGGLDAVAYEERGQKAGAFVALDLGRGVAEFRPAPALSRAEPPFARAADGSLIFAEGGVLKALGEQGEARVVAGGSTLDDRRFLDATRAGADLLITTRASDVGHLRVRSVGPSGGALHLDDAREASLAPDGRSLAYAGLSADRFQLMVAGRDKPLEARQLTRGEGHVAFPVWSPDGSRIAFVLRPDTSLLAGGARVPNASLWVTDREGHARLLAEGDIVPRRPLWTEDGVKVLARQQGKKGDIETVVWNVVPRP